MLGDSSLTGDLARSEASAGHELDSSLVERAACGDEAAFRALFDQYERVIYNLVYGIIRDQEEAADLTQEVFLRAYGSLRRLRSPQAFPAWLRRIAVNLCQDHLKARRLPTVSLRSVRREEGDSADRELPDEAGDAPAHLLGQELQQAVQQAVASLSVDHRVVVTLHHLQGLGVAEIAHTLGIPAGTVKSRLSRARSELKRKLQPYIEGEKGL